MDVGKPDVRPGVKQKHFPQVWWRLLQEIHTGDSIQPFGPPSCSAIVHLMPHLQTERRGGDHRSWSVWANPASVWVPGNQEWNFLNLKPECIYQSCLFVCTGFWLQFFFQASSCSCRQLHRPFAVAQRQLKKSSQCCVLVDPSLFLHIIPSLMPPHSLMGTHADAGPFSGMLAFAHPHWECQLSRWNGESFCYKILQIVMTWQHRIWGISEARAEGSHVISKTYWSTHFFHVFPGGGMRPHQVWLASRRHSAEVKCSRGHALWHKHRCILESPRKRSHSWQSPACSVALVALERAHMHSCSRLSQHTAGVSWSSIQLAGALKLSDIFRTAFPLFLNVCALLRLLWRIGLD